MPWDLSFHAVVTWGWAESLPGPRKEDQGRAETARGLSDGAGGTEPEPSISSLDKHDTSVLYRGHFLFVAFHLV